MVVGHPQHFHAVRLQPGLGVFQLLLGVDAERDVVDPQRGVGRGQRRFVVAQVKKCDERAVQQAEEKVGVRAVFPRAGHVVALDDVVQRQTQDVFVEVPGFFGVAGLVGVVVQLLHGSGRGQVREVFQNGGHGVSCVFPGAESGV